MTSAPAEVLQYIQAHLVVLTTSAPTTARSSGSGGHTFVIACVGALTGVGGLLLGVANYVKGGPQIKVMKEDVSVLVPWGGDAASTSDKTCTMTVLVANKGRGPATVDAIMLSEISPFKDRILRRGSPWTIHEADERDILSGPKLPYLLEVGPSKEWQVDLIGVWRRGAPFYDQTDDGFDPGPTAFRIALRLGNGGTVYGRRKVELDYPPDSVRFKTFGDP